MKFSEQNNLAVPMRDGSNRLFGLQIIRGSGKGKKLEKQYFPPGLDKVGHYHLIGTPRELVLIAEGYATAATIHELTGLPIAVAFDANNISPVAKSLKNTYKQATIVICADDDYLQKCASCKEQTTIETIDCIHCKKPHLKKNAGIEVSQNAALSTDGIWVKPNFITDGTDLRNGKKLTDFNDLAQLDPNLAKHQIEEAVQNIALKTPAKMSVPVPKGVGERPNAVSIMPVDELVERFIYVDEEAGDTCFDNYTKSLVRLQKVKGLVPAKMRWEEVKSHPTCMGNAVYIDQVGFDPTERDPTIICNLFGGWPMQPKQGNCEGLLLMLEYLTGGEDNPTEVFEWVKKWLAYPLQNPGAKMKSAIVPDSETRNTYKYT